MYSRCCFFHDPLQYATSRDDAPPAEDQRRTDLSWRPQVGLPLLWTVAMAETSYLWEGPTLGGKGTATALRHGMPMGPFLDSSHPTKFVQQLGTPEIQFNHHLSHSLLPYWSILIQKKIHIGHWGYPVSPWAEIGPRQFQSRRGNMLTLAIFFWATIYPKRLTDVRFRPTLRMHSSSQ